MCRILVAIEPRNTLPIAPPMPREPIDQQVRGQISLFSSHQLREELSCLVDQRK